MREILFRGKRIDNGEWVYGNYAFCDYFTQQQHYIFQNKLLEHAVFQTTVGQYTGMTDKNGVKIFEGDILKIHNDYIGDPCPFDAVVAFRQGEFVCQYIGDEMYNHFDGWNVPFVWWEIIGNIHDNPELLEVGGTKDD